MSGDSEAPPTYYFSGITFNPTFYTAASGNYLTLATAKNSFLTYPSAQGTETISTLYSSAIDSAATSSDLSIASSQTSGILNIGTGARLTSGNGGGINIGTGSSAVVNPITIGGASSAIAMNGTCTFAKQISASLGMTSAGNITTSGAATITALSSGFLIGPYKNAATSTASITDVGVITGSKLVVPTVDCATSATSMYLGSNLDTGNIFLGSVISTGNITIGRESGNHTGVITIGGSQTSGTMDIATKSTRTGALNINNTSGQTNSINIGTTGTPVSITGNTVSIDGALKLGTAQTTGTMEIATSATRSGNLFIASTTGQTNNIYIGASGTKTFLDGTITMKSPSLTNTGSTPATQAATNMTVYGGLMYSYVNAAYTIPASGTINRDFYIVVVGSGTFTITMPAIAIHQIIHIRNQNSSAINLTAPLAGTRFYPTQTGGGLSTTTYSMPANTAQNFYCDGLDWQGI